MQRLKRQQMATGRNTLLRTLSDAVALRAKRDRWQCAQNQESYRTTQKQIAERIDFVTRYFPATSGKQPAEHLTEKTARSCLRFSQPGRDGAPQT
jgi:hypothetical protein